MRFQIEIKNHEYIRTLEGRIAELEAANKSLLRENHISAQRYGEEVNINNQLCDLLRQHKIDFRKSLSIKGR